MAKNPRKHYIRAVYDFTVDGGVVGAVTLADTAKLPDNAIVNEVCISVGTAYTSGGGSSVQVTGGGVNLTAAIPKADLTANTVVAADIVDAGGKATSAANIGVTIATTAGTAGDMEIIVGYYLGS
tara:strand:+ start:235 stop:609 length:375 start_codon:yes stop_codon:yes gene_type:complete